MRPSRRPPSAMDPRFVLQDHEPAYLQGHRQNKIRSKLDSAREALQNCTLCPRNCQVNRLEGERGICQAERFALVTSAFPHHGEEDCLRGWGGSGTIFFALCNLRCSFCQNWDISHNHRGVEVEGATIADLTIQLQRQGCHNINFVTPSHFVVQVIEAIVEAIPQGLRLPIVYNTNGYDTVDSLRLLDGLVDIYLPDFKFWDPATAKQLCNAEHYPKVARAAFKEMHRQVGDLSFDRDGLARRGLLVRHLVMPGQVDQTKAIMEWLAREVSPDTFVNIMAQYRPEHRVGRRKGDGSMEFAEINRLPGIDEMAAAYAAAKGVGLWRFDTAW